MILFQPPTDTTTTCNQMCDKKPKPRDKTRAGTGTTAQLVPSQFVNAYCNVIIFGCYCVTSCKECSFSVCYN
jgi:hypothetical protein